MRLVLLALAAHSLLACTVARPQLRAEAPTPAPAGVPEAPREVWVEGGAQGPTLAAAARLPEAVLLPTWMQALPPGPPPTGARGRVVEAAASRVGRRSVGSRGLPDDCSGLVRHAFRAAGRDLMPEQGRPGENAVAAMHREAARRGALGAAPLAPGDLVFFRETYDRNRDGKRNDGLTHVGIVEQVGADGTVVFIHRGMKGVTRSRFNLRRPGQHLSSSGRVLNAWLRPASRTLRAYFAGELYEGHASAEALLEGPRPPPEAPPAVAETSGRGRREVRREGRHPASRR